MLSNPSSSTARHRLWRTGAFVCFVLIVVLGVFTVADYGMSWDEAFRFRGGEAKLDYYQQLVSGESVEPLTDTYPGLFDLPLAAVHEWFPGAGSHSEKGHVLSLLFGLVGLASGWRLTARIGGERAGFWALLFLVALPRYYGHMFMNPKDVPFAATYLLSLWCLVALFQALPKPAWRQVLLVGVTAGLALSTRIAGMLILFYYALFVGLFLVLSYQVRIRQKESGWGQSLKADVIYWLIRGVAAGIVALCILAVFWPTMHQNPFDQIGHSLGSAQSYGWDGLVLMDGQFWRALKLPISYVPNWLLRTTPEYILILLVAAVCIGALCCRRWISARRLPEATRLVPIGLVGFSFLFPLVYILLKRPVLYDGLRHFLFILPPAVCVSALSFEWILKRLNTRWQQILQLSVAAMVATVLWSMVQLHPYQYVYFNQLSGGLPAAYMRDETDYWGLSHKEAGDWLNAYVDTLNTGDERVYRVYQGYSEWMLDEVLDERFVFTNDPKDADFYVAITRLNFHGKSPESPILHVVSRGGVPLCYIFALSEDVMPADVSTISGEGSTFIELK
jgi:hypothetical protein